LCEHRWVLVIGASSIDVAISASTASRSASVIRRRPMPRVSPSSGYALATIRSRNIGVQSNDAAAERSTAASPG
jgi:hypothetical protein